VNGSDVFGAGFFAGPQELVPIGVIAHNKATIDIVPALPAANAHPTGAVGGSEILQFFKKGITNT
jgi:hypothetical protein